LESILNAISDNAALVVFVAFLLMFLEAAGIPLPSLTFALLAAALAGQGALPFLPVYLAVILGATLGGPVGYRLGKHRGRPLLERMGGYMKLTPERIDSSGQQFERRSNVFLLGRFFVPILPWAASLFGGMSAMPMRRFFFLSMFGIILWATIEMTIAAYFSSQIKDFLASISVTGLLIVAFGVLGGIALYALVRRRRASRQQANP
jgi:membrane protein DedA with SNARE-associated domain